MKKIYILSLTCILLIILSIGGVLIYPHIEHILPRNSIFRRMLMSTEERNKKVMLVVAKHDYPKGTTITDPEQMFELREFLEADGPFVAFENLDEVSQDFVLIDDIREGQPLTRKSVAFRIAKALMDLTSDDPPGPGRAYWAIIDAKAHQGSIRVGSRVDVIDKDPNGESKIVFHDVVVRYVMAASKNLQEIIYFYEN